VLDEMGLGAVPELLVFNKIDRLPPGEGARLAREDGAVAVSGRPGAGPAAPAPRRAREYGAVPASARAATGLAALLEGVDELLFEGGRPAGLAAEPRDAIPAIGRGGACCEPRSRAPGCSFPTAGSRTRISKR